MALGGKAELGVMEPGSAVDPDLFMEEVLKRDSAVARRVYGEGEGRR